MLELWFPTPIYYEDIESPTLEPIQAGFQEAFNDLVEKRSFNYIPDWNSHLLSDTTFSKNLVEDYNLTAFKDELDKHVKAYLKVMEYPGSTKYRIKASWMTLFQKGNYAHIHAHGDADMSGVYYFKTSGTDGQIFFETPVKTMGTSLLYTHLVSRTYYPPKEGRIILFPSWAEHGVQTMIEDGQRVSISFNLEFER